MAEDNPNRKVILEFRFFCTNNKNNFYFENVTKAVLIMQMSQRYQGLQTNVLVINLSLNITYTTFCFKQTYHLRQLFSGGVLDLCCHRYNLPKGAGTRPPVSGLEHLKCGTVPEKTNTHFYSI